MVNLSYYAGRKGNTVATTKELDPEILERVKERFENRKNPKVKVDFHSLLRLLGDTCKSAESIGKELGCGWQTVQYYFNNYCREIFPEWNSLKHRQKMCFLKNKALLAANMRKSIPPDLQMVAEEAIKWGLGVESVVVRKSSGALAPSLKLLRIAGKVCQIYHVSHTMGKRGYPAKYSMVNCAKYDKSAEVWVVVQTLQNELAKFFVFPLSLLEEKLGKVPSKIYLRANQSRYPRRKRAFETDEYLDAWQLIKI